MKIKLMIVALVAVFGLQGMENPYENTLMLALTRSIKSGLEADDKRPRVVHLYSNKDEQYSSPTKIEDLVAGSLKSNFGPQFAQSSTISLCSGVEDNDFLSKCLSKDHKTWISFKDYFNDYFNDESRLTRVCVIIDIVDDKSAECFLRKSQTYALYSTPILINFNTSGVHDNMSILCILKKDNVEIFGHMPDNISRLLAYDSQGQVEELGDHAKAFNFNESPDKLLKQSEDLALNTNKESGNAESVALLVKATNALAEESKVFQSNNNDKKRVGSLSALFNFLTNRWTIVGGASLAVLVACYYDLFR